MLKISYVKLDNILITLVENLLYGMMYMLIISCHIIAKIIGFTSFQMTAIITGFMLWWFKWSSCACCYSWELYVMITTWMVTFYINKSYSHPCSSPLSPFQWNLILYSTEKGVCVVMINFMYPLV